MYESYAAAWEQLAFNGPPYAVHHRLNTGAFAAQHNSLKDQGYRPRIISVCVESGQELFSAVWEQSSGIPWSMIYDVDSNAYQHEFDRLKALGYVPTYVTGYQGRFAGIWEQRDSPDIESHHMLTGDQYQQTFERLSNQGYRPIVVNGYNIGGDDWYAAIFLKAPGAAYAAYHRITGDQLYSFYQGNSLRMMALTHISGYQIQGKNHYTAIFELTSRSGPEPRWARSVGTWTFDFDMSGDGFQQKFETENSAGLRVRSLCVYNYGASTGELDQVVSPPPPPGGSSNPPPPPLAAAVLQLTYIGGSTSSGSTYDVKITGVGFFPGESVTLHDNFGTAPSQASILIGTATADVVGRIAWPSYGIPKSPGHAVAHTIAAFGMLSFVKATAGVNV